MLLINSLKNFGNLNNSKKISDDKMPKINPNVMLNIQLPNAIKMVSFNLANKFINISIFIFGITIDDKNSRKISIPPKWKFLNKWKPKGIKINIGKKQIKVELNKIFFTK